MNFNQGSLLSLTLVLVLSAGAGGHGAAAAPSDPVVAWEPAELIVKFRPGATAADKSALVPGRRLQAFAATGVERWRIDGGRDVLEVAAELSTDPRVAYAEPNYLLHVAATPNDPLLPQQWGLHNTGQVVGSVAGTPGADIDAVEAWGLHSDASAVLVAVLDTGIDLSHPDLAPNLWSNTGEVAGNGLDDDGNGYVDDIHGWDFYNGDSDPSDDNSHGTHCAGIIGAVTDNGAGVAGVAWGARLMPLKFQSASGIGSTSNAIAGIEYAIAKGVDVINASWGNRSFSQALLDAIMAAYEADIYFVASAGNEGRDNDALAWYPAGYDAPNVVSVMATDNRDRRADDYGWASNYGAQSVDIAAPGLRIWSTIRNGGYMYLSGTSMAAPHVAGALALLRGRFPGIGVDEGLFRLLAVGYDEVPALAGQCVTGGRLNLRRLVADPDESPPPPINDLAVTLVASNWVTLAWTSPGDDRALDGWEVRSASSPINDEAGWSAATPATDTPQPAPAGTPVTSRVTGLAAGATAWFSVRARDEYGNLGGLSASPSATTLPPPAVVVSPPALSAALAPGAAATRVLTIANPGPGVLDFTIPLHRSNAAKAGSDAPLGYGYDWTDSDTPGGPAYDWIDVSADGTPVTLIHESNQGPFPIGFPFPFYGEEYSTFTISTHGCISFTSSWTSGDNIAIPSPGAPANLVALLWDQMVTGVGSCRYRSDGNRLVVQFDDVDLASGGGPVTMQARLYRTGEIELCYQEAGASGSASATVGIQDGSGLDGLAIACNEDYVHDGLEVLISPPPVWLSADPASGSVVAGSSVDVYVTFDAAPVCGTRFDGSLHVRANDPLSPDVIVPAGMDVASSPTVGASPSALDFGPVRLGESATQVLALANTGCADLVIAALTFDIAGFSSARPLPLVLGPGQATELPVTFAPVAPGATTGLLTIASNDPLSPAIAVALAGSGSFAPDISLSTGAVDVVVHTGGLASRQVTITNNGLMPLDFTVPVPECRADTAAGAAQGDKGAGGPDGYGYRWTDSDMTRGPAYNWIEIQTSGSWIPLTDNWQNKGPFNIGFEFPFYGRTYTTFRACSNGWISFTSSANSGTDLALPSLSAPEALIAPYWDNLSFHLTSARAWYRYDGKRLIIEYKSVPVASGGGLCSFQVHLYPSGRIEYHYQAVPTYGGGATIGIQSHDRTTGLTVAHSANFAHAYHAVRLEQEPQWVSVSPASGSLASGASAVLDLAFDAGMLCGTHAADLHVLSNDPETPDVVVPLSLNATGGPDPRSSPVSLSFGNLLVQEGATLNVLLHNLGCDPLEVTSVSVGDPQYTVVPSTPFTLATSASRSLAVTFAPVAAGQFPAALTLATSHAEWPLLSIPLSGGGLAPPRLEFDTSPVALVVRPDSMRTATIRLANTGGSDLTFSTSYALADKSAAMAFAGSDSAAGTAVPVEEPAVAPLGSGGPDAEGYRWVDSDSPGGPAFSWIEIAGTGTQAMTSDVAGMVWQLPIGFYTTLYGTRSGSFGVNTDGWMCLVESSYSNQPNGGLPSSYIGGCGIAPFWDDLTLAGASGDVWYQNVDGNLVVEWDHVLRAGTSTPVTFEVILSPQGNITFQYLSVEGAVTNSATVGIQNAGRYVALQVARNQPYLHDNLAIRIWRPEWLTVWPPISVIPAGGSMDLALEFDAREMSAGLHHGQLTIASNDIERPSVVVPLVMEVKDYVSAADPAPPTVVALGPNLPNPFNPETVIRFSLPTAGTARLDIYDVRGRHLRTLVDGECAAGHHEERWDGRADSGATLPSGVYFCRLRAAGHDLTRRMALLR